MNKRPIAVICVFFISGIILARYLPCSIRFLHLFAAVSIFILASFIFSRYEKLSNAFLFLSIIFFAALLYLNSNILPNSHINRFLGEEGLKASIIGTIRGPALTRRPYFGKINSTYLFEIEAIKQQATSDKRQGGAWVNVEGFAQIRIQTERDYVYGDRLLVRGAIRKPDSVAAKLALPTGALGRASSAATQRKKRSFNYRE
ncbi:MAG: DUF4131 domain-containing protein, partial [Candidatus Omnitrophica bacterium]|nr:DUF4131 domain-containing protein [Candidatus Omnitrophota bacterium]